MRTRVLIYRRIFYLAVSMGLIALTVLAYERVISSKWSATVLNTSAMRYTYQPGDELLGGATTVIDTGKGSYGRSLLNLQKPHWQPFYMGKDIFTREWDQMPDRSPSPIGPLFSAVGCERCHEHDGRGQPPAPHEISESMIVRFSVPGPDKQWNPEPNYGDQLDMYHVGGQTGEGIVQVAYDELTGEYADGGTFTLAKPEYSFAHLANGPLDPNVRFSPRVAPFNFGLGLLEAIPEQDILAHADPDDRDHDGITGRANMVIDVKNSCTALGRFGWKANQPTVEQQIAKAFNADIGITSSLFPINASSHSAVQASTSHPELSAEDFRTIVMYVRLLAVPKERSWQNAVVQRGRAIFDGIHCSGCHISRFETGEVAEFPELSHQTIHPYTDLLLHDMGEGLADGRPDGLASGSEWRTPPLWGIGLVKNVSKHTRFLHDGRARSLEEAILWHGGEASGSQELYRRLGVSDRAAVLAFLGSL